MDTQEYTYTAYSPLPPSLPVLAVVFAVETASTVVEEFDAISAVIGSRRMIVLVARLRELPVIQFDESSPEIEW